jgi:sugar phosphate isomerase/epimerase
MKLGVYNAILHDRPLPEALAVIAGLGLTGIEINSGGFLPATHLPTFDDILESDTARDDYLGVFEASGVSIAATHCTPTRRSGNGMPKTCGARSGSPTGSVNTGW